LKASSEIVIYSSPADVMRFIDSVRSNADSDKNALGFLPPAAYDGAAERGNLFVATKDGQCIGHLLFGGTFPRGRIFQLYVTAEYRKRGVAATLLSQLISSLESVGFLTISAKVADDLAANSFWEKAGFPVLRVKPGGPSRGRLINHRVKDLDTPHLFRSGSIKDTDLGIASRYATPLPVFLIDLNVFWDIVKHRPRSEYAAQVIGAALDNFIRVLVADEFARELQRTAISSDTDPVLEFALELPALSRPPDEVLVPLHKELSEIIFHTCSQNRPLSVRDNSDILHLGTAIHHRATGFVTSEEAMVRCRDEIYLRYGVEILHVKNFATALASRKNQIQPLHVQLSSDTLSVRELIEADDKSLLDFLDIVGASLHAQQDFLPGSTSVIHRKRVVVTSQSDMVCVASWDARAGLRNRVDVRLLVNEEHPAAEAAIDCLIGRICAEASGLATVLLELVVPIGSALTSKAAYIHGFRSAKEPVEERMVLQKVCVGGPVSWANWPRISSAITQCAGLAFPPDLPSFEDCGQPISFVDADGNPRYISLWELEKLMSPVLLILPGRSGVIAPIQRAYADELFGSSPQMSFMPRKEAILHSERAYFSAARNAGIMTKGIPLLFYESGGDNGRSAVIAAARVVDTVAIEKRKISSTLLRLGVVEAGDLQGLTVSDGVAVTKFDNVMLFKKPVSLARLRRLGCVDGANLVTARRISAEQLSAVLMEGDRNE
jgi:GNAT superfamily N-acetyltransferase